MHVQKTAACGIIVSPHTRMAVMLTDQHNTQQSCYHPALPESTTARGSPRTDGRDASPKRALKPALQASSMRFGCRSNAT